MNNRKTSMSALPQNIMPFQSVTAFRALALALGYVVVASGCARSMISQDSARNQASQSQRRASAAATPLQKQDRQIATHEQPIAHPSSPVQTVSYEERVPPNFDLGASTSYIQENSQRVPSHMLPVSNMRPVPMNGVPATPNFHQGSPVRGCGGKCCSPQEGYAPIYPQFSTSGDLSSTGINNVYSNGCGQNDFASCNSSCAPLPYANNQMPRYIDPQEYVYDGGDRAPEARLRQDLSVVGLDSEDTVIRYETTSGSVELQTGCRVPIYSPRFSSVRKIVSLNLSEHAVATQATLLEEKPTRVHDILPSNKLVKNDSPIREANVKVIEALRDRNRGVPVLKVIPAIDISDAFKPYEDLALIRTGRLQERDRPLLTRSTQAALNWTNVDQLVVLIHNVAANIVESVDTAQELYNYELGNSRVRLCKVASHQVAEPGDIIDFTIRFDNTGDQKITNIMIQDSLAPRLEYVEGSQKSSIESTFSLEANDAGSSTLTWNISQEVAPGTGGFLRFQCKVR